MRILQIMASRALGGAETYAADVMLKLHEAGVDQCVVMHRNAPRFAELRSAGIRLAPAPLRFPFLAAQRLALSSLAARENPDIIQTWMRRAASMAPTVNKPVIGWFGGYYDPHHFRKCDHLVGVTRDIVAHMIKNGVAAGRAHYIPTFPVITPLPALDRSSLETPKEARVLLTLSRLHQKKGLDTLLKALTELPDCIAWIAGDGPLKSELEQQARESGVMDRVRFLGWRTDRSALLRAADVCLLPSRYEPFGNVILEAWAARAPLVACASAGPAAHIKDGETGLLTPIDDAPALAAAVRRVLTDSGLRRKMIAEGYAAYVRGFTPEAVIKQWQDFYELMMKQGSRPQKPK